MVHVITISREYGSGGREIARRVAEALGWELVDRALIERVAELAGVAPDALADLDERCDTFMARLAKVLWAGSPEVFSGPPGIDVLDADRFQALSQRVVEEAANQGHAVIVGRGAQCILAGRADVFHAFVYAPLAARLARVAGRYRDETEAREELARIDRERILYTSHYYGCEWAGRGSFDLLVNAAIGEENAVRAILAAAGLAPSPS